MIKDIRDRVLNARKAIIMTAAGLAVFFGLVIAGIVFFTGSPDKTQDAQTGAGENKSGKTVIPMEFDPVFDDILDLAPFDRIALKPGSDMEFVSLTLSLELSDRGYRNPVLAMEDTIRQIITGQVREMTWSELRHPEGKIMLRYDLLKQINSIFPQVMVRNIYFTYFIMQ